MPNCLAATGSDPHLPLLAGLVFAVLGVAVFVAMRGRLRSGGAAVVLALALVVSGGLTLTSASPAQAATCPTPTPTPTFAPPSLDFTISAGLTDPQASNNVGFPIRMWFQLTNLDAVEDSSQQITVRIPKYAGMVVTNYNSSFQWESIDETSDPDNYVFIYTYVLAAGETTALNELTFTLANAGDYEIVVTIDTGSAGDNNSANNSAIVAFTVDDIAP